ncbi:MAG: isoprenylcysteine carboxylmethyltransferase family protein [Chloroflexota bacterium]|nr:isoprenylcysteine carboxylmethyltransferase family protein [Chloroflexota bacterium]
MAGQFILLGLVAVASVPYLGSIVPQTFVRWMLLVVGGAEMLIGAWGISRAFGDLGRSLTPLPRPHAEAEMVERGIYRRIRHPIYAGLILAAIGWATLTASPPAFVVALALGLFMDAKARREEAWLTDRYPEYADYRTRTKRFLPGVY